MGNEQLQPLLDRALESLRAKNKIIAELRAQLGDANARIANHERLIAWLKRDKEELQNANRQYAETILGSNRRNHRSE